MEYLTETVKARIRSYSSLDSEREACGFVVRDDFGIPSAVSCKNIALDPENSFAVPHSAFRSLKSKGCLAAIWHSHPPPCDEGLSELDRAMSERLGVDFVAYDTSRDAFVAHSPRGYEVPYLGRPFVSGVFDCWSLVQDWYARELNIKLEDICHPIRDVSGMSLWRLVAEKDAANHDSFRLELQKRGFSPVPMEEKRRNDILLMNYENIKSPLHTAVYLGGDRILHHPEAALSEETHFNDYWKRFTVLCMRHPMA